MDVQLGKLPRHISIHAPIWVRPLGGIYQYRPDIVEFQSMHPYGVQPFARCLASFVTYFNPRTVWGATARHCAVCDPIGSFVIDFDNGTSLFARKT